MGSKILYLGTDPSRYGREVVHCPLIATQPLLLPENVVKDWEQFTHIILTSPNAARILGDQKSLEGKKILAIGTGTAEALQSAPFKVAVPPTQEGMIKLLKTIPLVHSYILYPRSSAARALLALYLKEAGFKHQTCDLYDTVYLTPDHLPSLDNFDEIVFTSPSTIKAFLALYGLIPKRVKMTCLGPVTQKFLNDVLEQ